MINNKKAVKPKTLNRTLSIFLLLSLAHPCSTSTRHLAQTFSVIFKRTFTTVAKKLSRQELLKLIQRHSAKPFVQKNRRLFEAATDRFYKKPGFQTTLRKALVSPEIYAKGFLYELEKAVNLANQGETLVAFAQKKQSQQTQKQREFDLITTKRAIECKNITWNKKYGSHIKQQIFDQQKIIEHCNAHNAMEPDLSFCVCSKNRIPDDWKTWFDKNEITFHEDNES